MPAAAAKSPVTLGYVSRPNGLQGAVVVHSDPSMTGMFAKGLEVELRPRSGTVLRTTVRSASHVKDGVRVTFDRVADRDAAEALVGATIVVERNALGEMREGEYLDTDLVGLEVRAHDNRALGRLVEVIATGANDVYVVAAADGSEILIPATANAEIEVDLAAGRMTVAAEALEYGAPPQKNDEESR
ncbi:MAG TPA: ribosome maturation factor RimM [Candidatus Limnocylindrales bacterium]|nr:ribosome maturation factor RimM [Candidatus Limnocylindrales bacterium]